MAEPTHAGILAEMRPTSILFLLFILIPPIEIGLFIVVGSRVGLLPTLGIVLVTAVIASARSFWRARVPSSTRSSSASRSSLILDIVIARRSCSIRGSADTCY